jgi:glutamate synthase (NADPH/NADH) large chain
MTGGKVVILGPTGRNFAAGMSGGVAYVYDPDGVFEHKCNLAMVGIEPLLSGVEQELRIPRELWHAASRGGATETDEAIVRRLVEAHFRYTGSFRAKEILHDWPAARARFVKVMPSEYRRALSELHQRAVLASTEKATA